MVNHGCAAPTHRPCCPPHPLLCAQVSGYPVASYDRVVSKQNGFDVVAIRDHWNTWVTTFRTCPVTGGSATPMY